MNMPQSRYQVILHYGMVRLLGSKLLLAAVHDVRVEPSGQPLPNGHLGGLDKLSPIVLVKKLS